MAHARETIRTAVVSALTGLTTTGSNVTSGRIYAEPAEPSLSIYTSSEAVLEEENVLGTKQTRELTLTVEGRAKAPPTSSDTTVLEDLLDDICSEVEAALAADETLGAIGTKLVRITSTEYELTGEQEQPLGVATMQWRIIYRVDATAPGTIIN